MKDFIHEVTIYYAQTDASGVVYHANYIELCERARCEYILQKGKKLVSEGAFYVIRSLRADFIKPAFLGDKLKIVSNTTKMKNASFEVEQKIYKDDELLFVCNLLIACVRDNKPVRLTKEMIEIFG